MATVKSQRKKKLSLAVRLRPAANDGSVAALSERTRFVLATSSNIKKACLGDARLLMPPHHTLQNLLDPPYYGIPPMVVRDFITGRGGDRIPERDICQKFDDCLSKLFGLFGDSDFTPIVERQPLCSNRC